MIDNYMLFIISCCFLLVAIFVIQNIGQKSLPYHDTNNKLKVIDINIVI